MPEYLSPGVYIEELSTGPRPIEGVSTSTAGFIGVTERGPEDPRLVLSWLEYRRLYGDYIPDTSDATNPSSYMPYAVQGFFDNGGQRMYVARVVAAGAPGPARNSYGDLNIMALGRGTWGNRIVVRIDAATNPPDPPPPTPWFRLTLLYYKAPFDFNNFRNPLDPANSGTPGVVQPQLIEQFDNLTSQPGASNNADSVVNLGSNLVRVWLNPVPTPTVSMSPFDLLQAGDGTPDGAPVLDDYRGNNDLLVDPAVDPRASELFGRGRGATALEAITEVSLLVAPGTVNQPDADRKDMLSLILDQCENLKDRFAIVAASFTESNPNFGQLRPPRDTTYAAYYYPWIQINDPVNRRPLLIPPAGHITGMIARTDIDRGVHKAPANEVLRDASTLHFLVSKRMQDILNPRGVNCVRDFRSEGRDIRVWGARTMSSDPEWRYVNVRRLFIFVEQSIYRATQWVVFEPNDEPLWAQLRRSITNFLVRVWKSGALMGLTQEEAFFVKCDRTTMTQDDIDNGRLVCYIGIAPVKPAEFVIFRFSQKTLEAQQ